MKHLFRAVICVGMIAVLSSGFPVFACAAEIVSSGSVRYVSPNSSGSASPEVSTYGPGGLDSSSRGQSYKNITPAATDWSKISQTRKALVEEAKGLLGIAYSYGGDNPQSGFDCSGFTLYIMKQKANISLPHSSKDQGTVGKEVSVSDMRPGDLICYDGDTSDPAINHVALYLGDGKVIHAAGTGQGVREDVWNYGAVMAIRNVLND